MRVILQYAAAAVVAASPLVCGNGIARADWRDEIEVLRVGILANGDAAYRAASLEPFRVYLQEKTGVPVEIVPLASYSELIDAQAGARVQYAIHSATSFATAAEQCQCVQAIGAPVAAGGALGFYSVLVSRADGPVRSLADARAKRIAFAGPDSVAGRLVPMQAFADQSIDVDAYFAEIVETENPEEAVRSLLVGKSDVAIAWSSLTGDSASGYDFGVLRQMASEGAIAMDQLRIVWQSRLIPFGPHVARSDLPAELKALLTGALLTMAGENPAALDAVDRLSFGGGGFATPDDSLYAVARDLVAAPPAAPVEEQ